MANLQLLDCLQPERRALEQVNYFPRQLLTVDDMVTERDYFLEKLRRHNRFLHGWGVVCGLEVLARPIPDMPWRVAITPGYAIGPYGDEIYVAEPVFLDLAKCGSGAATDPCEPSLLRPGRPGTGTTLYIAIKYAECLARPVRAMPAGCACEEEDCEYSRIRDSFQIECLTELPPSHQPHPGPTLCDLLTDKQLPLCPPCPSDPWVVLAQITLPASPATDIAANNIDNFTFRRLVFSTAVLQEQLIKCCCKPEEPPPPIEADLQIIKNVTREGPFGIRYQMAVKNNGPDPAQNVIVQDTVTVSPVSDPERVFKVVADSFEPAGTWVQTNLDQPFVAHLDTLNSGQQVDLSFRITVSGNRSGTVINTATVRSQTHEPNENNNMAQTATDIEIVT
jgi:hypothetical protein